MNRRYLEGRYLLVALFLVGLSLRLCGLLFNGIADLDQIILEWGCNVRQFGLGRAFGRIYGAFSYPLFGVAAGLAEQIPRFWWAPYKIMEILFELGVLLALYKLLPKERKHLAFLMYWLNPWFIMHGAWYGFWDGPHTFWALLGILCLGWVDKESLRWFCLGILLMVAAMFKPQGLVYFVVPVSIYLSLQLAVSRRRPFIGFILGLTLVVGLTALLLLVRGGEILAIPRNYLSVVTVMPNLSNESINIWRAITRLFQIILNQHGPTYTLSLPVFVYMLLHLFAFCLVLVLLVLFSLKLIAAQEELFAERFVSRMTLFIRLAGGIALVFFILGLFHHCRLLPQRWLFMGRYSLKYVMILAIAILSGCCAIFGAFFLTQQLKQILVKFKRQVTPGLLTKINIFAQSYAAADNIYLILAFSSLVIAQLGTMAHINHTYTALVLLIPLAITQRRICFCWLAMVAVQLYSYLASLQLGRGIVFSTQALNYPAAQALVLKINAALNPQAENPLLQFQNQVNQFLSKCLPREPFIAMLSVGQFILALLIIREMFCLGNKG